MTASRLTLPKAETQGGTLTAWQGDLTMEHSDSTMWCSHVSVAVIPTGSLRQRDVLISACQSVPDAVNSVTMQQHANVRQHSSRVFHTLARLHLHQIIFRGQVQVKETFCVFQ